MLNHFFTPPRHSAGMIRFAALVLLPADALVLAAFIGMEFASWFG